MFMLLYEVGIYFLFLRSMREGNGFVKEYGLSFF